MSKFLRYSGIIQPIAIKDALREKTVQIESYDFLKRMEQFPAALVSEEFGSFFKIPGIELKAYVEGQRKPDTSVREFSFKFPSDSRSLRSRRGSEKDEGGARGLPEVSIINVSSDTTDGIKILKYRSWGWFQWDQGPWVRKDLGDESTIAAWDGSTIECSFAGFTQDDNIEVVEIIGQSVFKRGGIEIIFDSGTPVYLGAPFTFIIRDDSGTLYDISMSCMVEKTESETAIASATDILYISAVERFRGMTFEFDEFLTGATLSFEYSTGSFQNWGDLSSYIVDGTNNFSQSGTVTITPPFNWTKAGQKVGEEGGDDIVVERYWLKISVSVWGSGTAKIRYLTRRHLAIGQDGDAIEIGVNFEQIEEMEEIESVIIRPSDSDSSVFVPATWKKNLPIELLLGSGSGSDPSSSVLAASGFSASCRDVEQLNYATSKAQFSIWGIPPYPSYPGEARCLCEGEDLGSAGRVILIGIGKEVWKVTEHTGFEFVFKLRDYYSTSLNKPFDVEIRRLNYDDTYNAVFGMAWKRYDNTEYRPVTNVQADAKKGRCTPAIVFRYDFNTDILDQQVIGKPRDKWETAESRFLSGEVYHRNGTGHQNGWPWWEIGGTPQHETTGGEMIPIPEQGHYSSIMYPIFVGEINRHVSLRRAIKLLETTTVLFWGDQYDIERFLYGDLVSGEDEFAHGRFALTSPGFYYAVRWAGAMTDPTIDNVHFRFTFGQPGVVVWNPYFRSYIYHDFKSDETPAYQNYIAEADYYPFTPPQPQWTLDRYFNLSTEDRQICCGALKENPGTPSAPELIYGEMRWYDINVAYVPQKSDSAVRRINLRTGSGATIFHSTSSSVNGTMSGHEETCTPIDLGYDPDQDVIHLTFFDRETFRYHYAVFDDTPAGDKYSTQAAVNFSFDWYRPIKCFAFHDGKMYAVCTDDRFRIEDAFLIEIVWSSPNITIRKIGVLRPGDYSAESLVWVGDTLYGLSKPSGTMWSYGTSWVPRVQLADFGEDNCRQAATKLCQAANAILRVDPDRVAIVEKRETVPVSTSTLEDELVEVKPEMTWKFIYDGCTVNWSFQELNGTESWGLTGRNQRVLKISNALVQDTHFAAKLAEIYGKFFFKERTLLPITAKFLPQFERGDLLKIISKGIDPNKDRSIVSFRLRNSNGQTEIGLVEQ